MAFGELIRLGDSFDGDSTLSTTAVLSDGIDMNGSLMQIQIEVTGGSGDTDDVEVRQVNSLSASNGTFETEGTLLGNITLDGTNTVIKSFTVEPTRRVKISLKMESGSVETPNYKGVYTIDSSIQIRVFQGV